MEAIKNQQKAFDNVEVKMSLFVIFFFAIRCEPPPHKFDRAFVKWCFLSGSVIHYICPGSNAQCRSWSYSSLHSGRNINWTDNQASAQSSTRTAKGWNFQSNKNFLQPKSSAVDAVDHLSHTPGMYVPVLLSLQFMSTSILWIDSEFNFQNGSIWDGLLLWKSNLDKKFEGVEECYICFSIVHQSSHQLPKMTCGTCKKKFHSFCLVRFQRNLLLQKKPSILSICQQNQKLAPIDEFCFLFLSVQMVHHEQHVYLSNMSEPLLITKKSYVATRHEKSGINYSVE